MGQVERYGVILVLSGPSGAGKSTMCNAVIAEDDNLEFSVSCTTRKPREGEIDGVHYHFLSREEFSAKVENGEFVEWAEVHGNYYGTLVSALLSRALSGVDVLLDIDVQGARLLREKSESDPRLARSVEFVFASAPSFDEIKSRLIGRGTETEESLKCRLQNARGELEAWNEYEYSIVLDSPESSVAALKALLKVLRSKTKRLKESPFNG